MASHFVVGPVIIVPELLPPNTVFNSELQSAPVVKVGGHDDLETELISVPVGGAGDICGQTVHERDPVVQGVAQRDALLESHVQDAHEAGEAEIVRFHRLQKHFHLPHFLLKAWQRAWVRELQFHEQRLRWSPGELGVQVMEGPLG